MAMTEGSGREKSVLSTMKFFPSAISLVGLCSGLLSINFALAENWEFAVLAIIVAGFLDAVDGRVARMLSADSVFGAQLDSLCDIINFGVCPAVVLYLWGFAGVQVSGWAAVSFYVSCMAIRLARFNAAALQKRDSDILDGMFFTGVPAPAGAALLFLPMVLSLSRDDVFDQRLSPAQVELYILLISSLLVSPIATFSHKAIKIDKKNIYLAMACFALFIACCFMKPWIVLPIVCTAYLLSIPLSAVMAVMLRRL
jgi:CDP-diacylglycerol--serine O-phosphatidyltransferase